MADYRRTGVTEGADAASMITNIFSQAIGGEAKIKQAETEKDRYIKDLEFQMKLYQLEKDKEQKRYEESTVSGAYANQVLGSFRMPKIYADTSMVLHKDLLSAITGFKKTETTAEAGITKAGISGGKPKEYKKTTQERALEALTEIRSGKFPSDPYFKNLTESEIINLTRGREAPIQGIMRGEEVPLTGYQPSWQKQGGGTDIAGAVAEAERLGKKPSDIVKAIIDEGGKPEDYGYVKSQFGLWSKKVVKKILKG